MLLKCERLELIEMEQTDTGMWINQKELIRMASGDELIKYITERVVHFIDTPKDVRRQAKVKESWTTRWFGMIPFSMSLWKEDVTTKRKKKGRSNS